MAYVAFRMNETGFNACHSYCGEESPTKKKDALQKFYDRVFGKGLYTFYVVYDFFKPYTREVHVPDSNTRTCLDAYEEGYPS